MSDEYLRQRFADWASPARELAPPDVSVIRRRARRRAGTSIASGAVAALVLGLAATLLIANLPDTGHRLPGPATRLSPRVLPSPDATLSASDSLVFHAFALSPDGRTVAAGDGAGRTDLWSVATGRPAGRLTEPANGSVRAVAFSPGGLLATGDLDNGSLYLWDLASGRQVATFTDHPVPSKAGSGIIALAFSPDNRTIAAGDGNGSVYVWDRTTGKRTMILTPPRDPVASDPVSPEHVNHPYLVAFSPDGKTLAVVNGGDRVYLWNVATWRLAATLANPPAADPASLRVVLSIAFSPDGKTLAAGSDDGTARLWNLVTGRLVATLADPGQPAAEALALAFSPDGATLVTGDGTSVANIWRVPSRARVAIIRMSPQVAAGFLWVGFTPDGQTLAIGSANNQIFLWRTSHLALQQ